MTSTQDPATSSRWRWHVTEGEGSTDGRLLRGERTHVRLVETLLEIVAEGELRPTAQQVADRAGVSLRTIYHHFDDADHLRRSALDLQMQRRAELLGDIDTTLPLDERLAEVTRRLRQLFEALTPIRRSSLLDETLSDEYAERIIRIQAIRRQFVERALAPELAQLGSGRRDRLDALDAAASWRNWQYVRTTLGHGAAATERLLAFTLRRLLEATATTGKARVSR